MAEKPRAFRQCFACRISECVELRWWRELLGDPAWLSAADAAPHMANGRGKPPPTLLRTPAAQRLEAVKSAARMPYRQPPITGCLFEPHRPGQVGGGGIEGLEAAFGGGALVEAGDALVFAEVESENGAGGCYPVGGAVAFLMQAPLEGAVLGDGMPFRLPRPPRLAWILSASPVMRSVMGHVVLLGDSIFDNARYVPDRPPVIEQLRQSLPQGWRATLLAVDGHITEDITNQLKELPADATHLVVSAGGNDALGESSILDEAACTVGDALGLVHEIRIRFQKSYRTMLEALFAVGKPVAVCTVYDAIPGLGPAEQVALAGFNEVILHEAFLAGLPLIDLRLVCDQPGDYSHVSPIEPSMVGGAKIARVIAEMVATHDFAQRRSTIYA